MERDKELLVSGTALVSEKEEGGEYQEKYPRQRSWGIRIGWVRFGWDHKAMGGVRYFHSVFGYKRRLLMLNVRSFTIDFVYVCVLEWFLSELLKSLISLCLAKHPPVSSNCGGGSRCFAQQSPISLCKHKGGDWWSGSLATNSNYV